MKTQVVSNLSINQAVDPRSNIPFRGDPQEFLSQFIGRAGNTRPGGMLIGADKIIENMQATQKKSRG